MDGGWTSWGNWSKCSVSCGGGTQTRSRSCTNPPAAYGGKPCLGLKEITQDCNKDIMCPGRKIILSFTIVHILAASICCFFPFQWMVAGQRGETGANVVRLVAEELKHVLVHAPSHPRPMVVKLVWVSRKCLRNATKMCSARVRRQHVYFDRFVLFNVRFAGRWSNSDIGSNESWQDQKFVTLKHEKMHTHFENAITIIIEKMRWAAFLQH